MPIEFLILLHRGIEETSKNYFSKSQTASWIDNQWKEMG